ncbi:MAG: PAS domain S-box protein, partial [Ignavibacteria bacterium]|nr:PAS domain S-box protein [Ignavibacteria bacterium]
LDGNKYWYETVVAPLNNNQPSSDLISITTDKTAIKKHEESIRRLNRANIVLSKINRAIVQNHDPVRLLDEACNIVIKDGGFLMAWIGMIDQQSKKIEVSTSTDIFGDDHNTDLFNLATEPNPSELSISRKRKVIVNDVENDDLTSAWKDIALKFGIKSVISLPLWRFGKIVGVFNMYSSQAGCFDEDEIRLLKELTSDVSFALEFIKIDIERFNAQKALIESEKDYRNLFEQANDAIIIFRPANEIIIEVNNKACELYGFKREEMIGMSFKKLTKDTLKGEKKIKDLFLLKKIQNYETIQNRKDGTPIYVSVNASLINYKNEEVIQSINRDITQNTKNIEA